MNKKIAIPIESDLGLDSKISDHFGKAPFYLMYNESSKEVTIIKNTSHHFGGKVHPPVLIRDAGATTVLTGSIGDHAKEIFEKFNIEVILGATGTAQKTLDLYLAGKL